MKNLLKIIALFSLNTFIFIGISRSNENTARDNHKSELMEATSLNTNGDKVKSDQVNDQRENSTE